MEKLTVKFAFESMIITKIMQGYKGMVRVDAKRRYGVADEEMFLSKWVTRKYADTLAQENYGKNCSNFACYEY